MRRVVGLLVGILLLCICLFLSITFGAADITPNAVWKALFAFDGSTNHLIITTVRLPRALIAQS
ncbi:MAG: iron ABC transporter permease [Microcoleus sp. SIO2G3]|nr:iron ABC transporter permease [Microcoleus sp. SIO2G3]